jgi:hypothetical protein
MNTLKEWIKGLLLRLESRKFISSALIEKFSQVYVKKIIADGSRAYRTNTKKDVPISTERFERTMKKERGTLPAKSRRVRSDDG